MNGECLITIVNANGALKSLLFSLNFSQFSKVAEMQTNVMNVRSIKHLRHKNLGLKSFKLSSLGDKYRQYRGEKKEGFIPCVF